MLAGERSNPFEEAVRAAVKASLANTWTALPGVVQAFDADRLTVDVQPTVQITPPGGEPANLPVLLDCPVQFPGGGGFTLTFPLAEGDEVLVVFGSRCIDGWWATGGVQPQAEARMHDLSDGFCIPVLRSQARKLANVSTTATQLRTDDGATLFELSDGKALLIADLELRGDMTGSGAAAFKGVVSSDSDVTAKTVSLHDHVHSGTQPGTGFSGGPKP